MNILELIQAIAEKHKHEKFVLRPPVSPDRLAIFEKHIGFPLPDDFRTFYTICDGFEMDDDDMFKFADLDEIMKGHGTKEKNAFHFADYLVYSDMWTLKYFGAGDYRIMHLGAKEIILTDSLAEFLGRFLQGGVSDNGGLYDWHDEVRLIR